MEISQIQESAVQCDESGCGWIQNIAWNKVVDWHKKTCPKCGKGEIVNDDDFAVWEGINAILLIDKAIDPMGELPRAAVTIDTSKMRV